LDWVKEMGMGMEQEKETGKVQAKEMG